MKFIFLDLEFNQKSGWIVEVTRGQDIIQVAYTVRDENFNELKSRNDYIKYDYNEISQKVKLLTGITFDNIRRGTSFEKAAKELFSEIDVNSVNDTYLMTWGDSDLKVLKRNFYKYKINSKILDKINVIDVQKIYMKKFNLKDHPSLVKIFEKDCYNAFINSKSTHHNAYYDAYALMEISRELGVEYLLKHKEYGILDNTPLKESMIDRSIRIKISSEKFRKLYSNKCNCKHCGKFTKLIFNDYICLDILNERRYHSQIRYCSRCRVVFIKRENVSPKHEIISFRMIAMDVRDKNYALLKRNISNHKSGELKLVDFLETV